MKLRDNQLGLDAGLGEDSTRSRTSPMRSVASWSAVPSPDRSAGRCSPARSSWRSSPRWRSGPTGARPTNPRRRCRAAGPSPARAAAPHRPGRAVRGGRRRAAAASCRRSSSTWVLPAVLDAAQGEGRTEQPGALVGPPGAELHVRQCERGHAHHRHVPVGHRQRHGRAYPGSARGGIAVVGVQRGQEGLDDDDHLRRAAMDRLDHAQRGLGHPTCLGQVAGLPGQVGHAHVDAGQTDRRAAAFGLGLGGGQLGAGAGHVAPRAYAAASRVRV